MSELFGVGAATHSVALLIDFEDLVTGAENSLPSHVEPIPYATVELLCRSYGNAAVRRAYADWTRARFNKYQESLILNGVDLVHVATAGAQHNDAVNVRLAIDAMEIAFTRPDVGRFVLIAGDGDYTTLVQRLRELGKRVVGVGTEATTGRRLVSVCSEYRYWPTLVAQFDPRARAAVEAEFDIGNAERLLVNAVRQSSQPVLAAVLKDRMLVLDPSFDEHNHGYGSFHEFLRRMHHVVTTRQEAYDLVVALSDTERIGEQPRVEPAVPVLLAELRALGADFPLLPDTRDALLTAVHGSWRAGNLRRVGDLGDVLLDQPAGHLPNKHTRLGLESALTGSATPAVRPAAIPLAEAPVAGVRPLRRCALAPYDGSSLADWRRRAHAAWLASVMERLKHHRDLDCAMVSTFFADSPESGWDLVADAQSF